MTVGRPIRQANRCLILVAIAQLCSFHTTRAHAGDSAPGNHDCPGPIYDPVIWLDFVNRSNDDARQENNRERVLQTLECIAIQDRTISTIGTQAVLALVHIAGDDSLLADRLIRIVVNPGTQEPVRATACRILPLITEETDEHKLIAFLKEQHDIGKVYSVYLALREIGSLEFQEFAQERAADPNEAEWFRQQCAAVVAQLQASQTLAGTLTVLNEGLENQRVDGALALRHAAHLGATSTQLRAAALAFLKRCNNQGRPGEGIDVALEGLNRAIFTAEDADNYQIIHNAKNIHGGRAAAPKWATYHKELEERFYRKESDTE